MNSEIFKEMKVIAKRYRKYGITLDDVRHFYKQWRDDGMSEKASLIGIRMGLSEIYNEREYFSSEDIATVTGESIEEINKRQDFRR